MIWRSELFGLSWRVSGMRRFALTYRLLASARRSRRTERSSSPQGKAFPGPVTKYNGRKYQHRRDGVHHSDGIFTAMERVHQKAFPRPTVHGNYNFVGASENSGDGIFTVMKRLRPWPRPVASDYKRGPDRPADRNRNSPNIASAMNINAGTVGERPSLRWLESLMGLPLGWTEPDGPPLTERSDTNTSPTFSP